MNDLLAAAVPVNWNAGSTTPVVHGLVAGGLVTFGATGTDGKVRAQYTEVRIQFFAER